MPVVAPRPDWIPATEPSTGLSWFDKLQQAMNTTPTPVSGLQGPGISGMRALLQMLGTVSSREGGSLPGAITTTAPDIVKSLALLRNKLGGIRMLSRPYSQLGSPNARLLEVASDTHVPQTIAENLPAYGGDPDKYLNILNQVIKPGPQIPPYGNYPLLLDAYLFGSSLP